MSVTIAVIASAADQERHWALVDCFAAWDGNVDQSVIEDGLFARYRAMGKPLKSLRFQRMNLREVEISAVFEYSASNEEVGIATVRQYDTNRGGGVYLRYGDAYVRAHLTHPEFFHQGEIDVLSKFVMDNVYHK